MSFLSFLEVDVEGNVNVSKLGKKPYLTAGCGGFVDITANARKIVFAGLFEAGAELELTEDALRVAKPGKFPKMVDAVEHVTFSGRRARETGQEVLYVTERCVIRLSRTASSPPRSCRGSSPRATSSASRAGAVAEARGCPALLGRPMGLRYDCRPRCRVHAESWHERCDPALTRWRLALMSAAATGRRGMSACT